MRNRGGLPSGGRICFVVARKTFGMIGPALLHPAINFTTSVSAMSRPSFLPIGSFLEAA